MEIEGLRQLRENAIFAGNASFIAKMAKIN